MTKVGTASNLNVQFVKIGSLSSGWFGTKGTLLENDMTHGSPMLGSINIVSVAIFDDLRCRYIEGLIVSTDKDFGSYLKMMMIIVVVVGLPRIQLVEM